MTVEELRLDHSYVVIESGPAGLIARVERPGGVEYAGPLPDETVDALREVAG